jgi:Holliday junction resolvase RusA-like endonuclease
MTTFTDMRTISFVVHGRPQQKGSKTSRWAPRKGGGINVWQVDSNVNARPWANLVTDAAMRAARDGRIALIRGAVDVELAFYFKRPKGHYGTGRNAGAVKSSAPLSMTTTPDIDKLARCALDALVGVLIADDSLVVELGLSKQYGEPERMEAQLIELVE